METSAFDNWNIQEAFRKLILEIYLMTIKHNIKASNVDKRNSSSFKGFDAGSSIKINDPHQFTYEENKKKNCTC